MGGGGGVSRAAIHFKKMLFMAYGNFEKGSQNQHIKSTLLVGGGGKGVTEKSTLCTLLIRLTILDDPLPTKHFH